MNVNINSRSAWFVTRLPKNNGFQGNIVLANPIYACSPIHSPPHISIANKWIALIEDNIYVKKCSNYQKILSAQFAWCSAVIVYNPDSDMDELERKILKINNDKTIPSLIIDYSNAEILRKLSYGVESYLIIYKNYFFVIMD